MIEFASFKNLWLTFLNEVFLSVSNKFMLTLILGGQTRMEPECKIKPYCNYPEKMGKV
jgi:hypothetical protein